MTVLCVLPGCRTYGEHTDTCDRSNCHGCRPRYVERPQVCEHCRIRTAGELRDLVDLYALLPAALEPSSQPAVRVSGSREQSLGVRTDVLDLLAPLTPAQRAADGVTDQHGDQTGRPSIAAWLDQHVRDWITYRPEHHEHPPDPTITTLAAWLYHRLDWAFDQHPAVDEFARELRNCTTALRGVLRINRHVDRFPKPCPTCEVKSLVRESGSRYVECRNCHRLWTEDEYARLDVVLEGKREVPA